MKGSTVCATCVCSVREVEHVYIVWHMCVYVCMYVGVCDVEHCMWMYGTYLCTYVCIARHMCMYV